jgi:serine/threonine protein phosphatase PrpC
VSRAFGDSGFKTPSVNSDKYSGSHGAVSVVPMFHHIKLRTGKTYYLILACDGLWSDGGIRKPFTNEEIMQMVALKQMTAQDLTAEAIARGSGDNVTAMIIKYEL